jgi:hypothetical protein
MNVADRPRPGPPAEWVLLCGLSNLAVDQMSHKGRIRRVRVIKDPVKYRQHQRKKLFAKLLKVTVYAIILLTAVGFIWFFLDMLFRPRPLD